MKILPLFEERQVDIDAFDAKFGEGAFKRFNKLKDRLKNNNISVDIVYHTKNTSVDDMTKLLYDTENRVVKDKDTGNTKLNRTLVAENEYYAVYNVLDWETSMNMGDGTSWCIAGRYETGGEVKPSQAKEYFNKYKGEDVSDYLFFMPKKSGIEKYCMCVSREDDFQFWTSEDDEYSIGEVPVNDKLPTFKFRGVSIVTNDGITVRGGVFVSADDSISGNFTIPNGVTIVGDRAFFYCTRLTSIVIPDTVTRIGDYAFNSCSSLTSVTIGNSVTSIGNSAFSYCSNLTSIIIPKSVTSIGDWVFYRCDNITISCEKGSYAEAYAKENGIPFKYLD